MRSQVTRLKPCKISCVGEADTRGDVARQKCARVGGGRGRKKSRREKEKKGKEKLETRLCWRGQLATGMWVRLPIGGPL